MSTSTVKRTRKAAAAPAATVPRPPQSELARQFRENGRLEAQVAIRMHLIQNKDKDNPRNGGEVRNRYRKFGEALAQAIRNDDPTPLLGPIGFELDASMIERIKERWTVRRCDQCRSLSRHGHVRVSEGGPGMSAHHGYVGTCCRHKFEFSSVSNSLYAKGNSVAVATAADGPDGFVFAQVDPEWAEGHCLRGRGSHRATYFTRSFFRVMYGMTDDERVMWNEGGDYDPALPPFSPKQFRSVGNYHSSKKYIHALSSKYDKYPIPLRVGLELEVEIKDGKLRGEAARDIRALLNGDDETNFTDYALCERDGSLKNGFEIVTAYGGPDIHEARLSRLNSKEFADIKKKYGMVSHDTTTCGLHVTVDRAGMNRLHQSKLVKFINDLANKPLVTAVCRRYAEGYCKIKSEHYNKLSRVNDNLVAMRDRYEILNMTHAKVFEFRGPKGTLRFESIMAAVEFIRMAWFFTKDAPINKLDTPTFLDFIWKVENREDSKYLREYLAARKFEGVYEEVRGVVDPKTPRRLSLTDAYADAVAAGHVATTADY